MKLFKGKKQKEAEECEYQTNLFRKLIVEDKLRDAINALHEDTCRRVKELEEINKVKNRLNDMNLNRAKDLEDQVNKMRSDYFNSVTLASQRSPYKEMKILLKKHNNNDLFDSYFFKVVQFCESELYKLRGDCQ